MYFVVEDYDSYNKHVMICPVISVNVLNLMNYIQRFCLFKHVYTSSLSYKKTILTEKKFKGFKLFKQFFRYEE